MERIEEVVIVGGGVAGLATAVGLKRVGVRALVLESAQALPTTGAALTLFPNAWAALALGVSHKLAPLYVPLRGIRTTNVATGAVSNAVFSSDNGGTERGARQVHRKALLEALAEELPADSIRFSPKLASIEIQHQGLAVLHLNDGTTIKSKVVIGCDGVHSVVAKWLGLSTPIASGRAGIRGLSHFPHGHNLDQHFQQYIDVGKRAGLVSLNPNEIYWFFTCPEREEPIRDAALVQKQVLENCAKDFPSEFKDVVRNADVSTLTWIPLMLRQPWRLILSKGNVTVCGDAMHPMTPDLGQGGCCSLEDAVVLSRHIGNSFVKNNGRIVASDRSRNLEKGE